MAAVGRRPWAGRGSLDVSRRIAKEVSGPVTTYLSREVSKYQCTAHYPVVQCVQFPSNIHAGNCPKIHLLARHVSAQCMTVGCAVHKTLSVLHVVLRNVVCAVLYMGGKHRVLCYRKNMG